MTIPLPSRIPLYKGLIFAVAMFVVQLLQGTSGSFAMLHFAFVILSILAFNIAGGFTSSSGWYIFFFTTLTVLVGTMLKAVLGEPADATSFAPVLSMAAFTIGAAGILLAISVSRALTKSIPSIAVRIGAREINYADASIGCTTMGLFIWFLRLFLPGGPGTIVSALNQLDIFFPLAILLGTVAVIQDSKGRRTLRVVNGAPMAIAFFLGVTTFTKQGMITPFVCWLIGVAYTRFNLKLIHLAACAGFTFLVMTVLYPIAQVGRDLVPEDGTIFSNVAIVSDLVDHLDNTQAIMNGAEENAREGAAVNYFVHNVGFMERFTRWPGDDELIQFSATGHYIGYRLVTDSFLNWFPHILLPHKEVGQVGYTGNYYMHEMGHLADDDTTTGISFSPIAEAFHLDGWLSLILVTPSIWFLLFLSIDLLCGDLRQTPWGLFYAVAFAHLAPEAALVGLINFIWHGNLALFLGMVFCVHAAPFVGALLTGSSRRSRMLQAPSLQPQT